MANNCDYEPSPLLEGLIAVVPGKTSHLEQAGAGMFPPEFNKLREVLYNEHADLWHICGGMMIHNNQMFLEFMNETLDIKVIIPGSTMAQDCARYIKALESYPKVYRS